MDLIGLVGLKGSGKDTVGQFFEQQYGYTTISFADSLKDCVCAIFGWDRTMIEGRTPKSRAWREQNDPWWAERLGLDFFSPRIAMTSFGTDVMRHHFRDDIWILNTERKVNAVDGPVVITDARFPNELDMIRRLGGLVCRVKRGPDPDWKSAAIDALAGDTDARMALDHLQIHESEWLLIDTPTHVILNNDSTIAALYEQCESIQRTYSQS